MRPLCLGASGSVRATSMHHFAYWAKVVQTFCPRDDPFVAVLDGAGLQRGEVGAGLGLGEALAPDLLGGQDRLQVALLLLIGAVGDDHRAAHRQAEHVGRAGRLLARRPRRRRSPARSSSRRGRRTPSARRCPAQPAACSLCCHSRRKAITSSSAALRLGAGVVLLAARSRTSSRNSCSDGESVRSIGWRDYLADWPGPGPADTALRSSRSACRCRAPRRSTS